MAKATTTKTTAPTTPLDVEIVNPSEVLPPASDDVKYSVGLGVTPTETDTIADTTDSNTSTIETYTIAHAEDNADADKVEAVAVDVADLSADKQTTIQPISQANTAKTGSYKAQWQLRHDGKVYNAGDSVELSEDDAKALLETGVIVKAE